MPLSPGLHLVMMAVVRFSVAVLQHVLALVPVRVAPRRKVGDHRHRSDKAHADHYQDADLETHETIIPLGPSTSGSGGENPPLLTAVPSLYPAIDTIPSTPNTTAATPIR